MVEQRKIIIPAQLSAEIRDLARKHGYNNTDFINLSVSLANLLFEERAQGNTVLLMDRNGKPFKQVALPTQEELDEMRGKGQDVRTQDSHSILNSIAYLDPEHPDNKSGWER